MEDILADEFKAAGLRPEARLRRTPRCWSGWSRSTGQWWLDVRKPSKVEVAAHLVNLAWNGLSELDKKPKLSPESTRQLRDGPKKF